MLQQFKQNYCNINGDAQNNWKNQLAESPKKTYVNIPKNNMSIKV